ncbi:cytochrome c oxidase assembly protein [Alteromonas oceanisediminis]|uniref:cytochrome c oxidase assembly protein n=1 Tax=Alteromonas oceanisediminis TaxID=2836180 RepID=UPI001BD980C6|nr:cytochrome c oxidase assembly protein [Alteromonas oceanisediminis]MBT0586197.1 cytochrome c oxidase assembly protein [Alteromonas oceanisediminis]
MSVVRLALPALALWSGQAIAHSPFSSSGQERIAAGITALVIILLWVMYEVGCSRASATPWRRGLFHATVLVTLLTVLGPLDQWAEESAAAHMTQHMFMMVIIAPAFALARPLAQYYTSWGRYGKQCWKLAFKITQYPMFCAYLHAAILWFWHIPTFYMLAVENPWIHVFEHACFLITAIWFWWACLNTYSSKAHYALLALLFTLMHTGFLGALLTFADSPLYGEARGLNDQQLAGLIMWVLGGIPYITAAIWAANRWYRKFDNAYTQE